MVGGGECPPYVSTMFCRFSDQLERLSPPRWKTPILNPNRKGQGFNIEYNFGEVIAVADGQPVAYLPVDYV